MSMYQHPNAAGIDKSISRLSISRLSKLGSLLSLFIIFNLVFALFACSSHAMSKPTEAKITERKQIIAHLEKLNPQDSFSFRESPIFPDFKADKPYTTGLKYNKHKRDTYYMTSALSKGKSFQMHTNWDDAWQQVKVEEGGSSYVSALLTRAIQEDLSNKLANPKDLHYVSVEESLYRRVRERVRTMADVRALLQREKHWISVHTSFNVKVSDQEVFNDNERLKKQVMSYMQVLQNLHNCQNKMKVGFHWSQGKGESYRSEFKHIELVWRDDDKKDADLTALLEKANFKHSISK